PRGGRACEGAAPRSRGYTDRRALRDRAWCARAWPDERRDGAMDTALLRAVAGRPLAVSGRVPEDIVVLRDRWLPVLGGVLAGMKRPAAAVTRGRTLVVHDAVSPTARLLRHAVDPLDQRKAAPW